MTSWTFKPPWWATLLVLVLVPVMAALGFWQLERGLAKAELQTRYAEAGNREPRDLTAGSVADPLMIERARLRGRYDGQRQLLLDNQSHRGRPGYHVLTPLLRPEGGMILVDRGWIALPASGTVPDMSVPADEEVEVEGYWRTLPVPGMRLASQNCDGNMRWPRLVQYPTFADLRCLYGEFIADGLLLLETDAPNGYTRDWQGAPELSPDKNYGYAVQWFAFALTLLAIYIKLNLRRKK